MTVLAECRSAAPDTRFVSDDGRFEGYAALFDVVDMGADVIQRGAFRETLRQRGSGGIRMLFQHDPAQPVGVWEYLTEDDRGLFARGRLATGSPRAAELLALLRAGALDGLSIGFRALRVRKDRRRGLRLVEAIDLWEISLVTFPMQPAARVERVAPHGVALPLAHRGTGHAVADAAVRMRHRLAHSRAATPLARSAELAGERVVLSLMRHALDER
jgi:hypothetical protein